MLTLQHRYELASRACIQAVAADGGINVAIEEYAFDYKHDGSFKRLKEVGSKVVPTGYPLEFQAKSSKDWRDMDNKIAYDLDATTYNHLVEQNSSNALPKMLILFCIANDNAPWVDVTHDAIQLRKSCYWLHLKGDKTSATTTKVVHIPKANLLTAQNLNQVLDWVNNHSISPPVSATP